MAAAAKTESGAPLAAELAAPASPPLAEAFVKIDAEEFARLQAEELARSETKEEERIALEHSAQVARDEQAQREVLDRAWRESQEYARAVAELKGKVSRREARRAPAIAVAILLAAGALGAVLYMLRDTRDPMSGSEASRAAVESRAREEEGKRAGMAPDAADKDAGAKPSLEPAAESGRDLAATARAEAEDLAARARAEAEDLAARARAEEETRKAVEDRLRAIALKSEEDRAKALAAKSAEEAGKKVELEVKPQAEEQARAEPAKIARAAPRPVQPPGTVFQDCLDCPRMVVIPAGEFMMGSLAPEAERGGDEGPQRRVSIAYPFALGRNEVTVAEFRRFAEASGYKTEAERDARAQGCSGFINLDPVAKDSEPQQVTSWRNPGFAQEDSHPVLCVSWNDVRAYAQWLSRKTGERYRLPTEAEWEYAARAGTSAARYWGEDPGQACPFANVADQSRFQIWGFGQKHECSDGHYFTAPAGSYAQNGFGLHDMLGNVWEWTEDCWNASYAGAPADGRAWLSGDCAQRVSRGGSWSTVPRYVRSASRNKHAAEHRDNLTGFRLARTLD